MAAASDQKANRNQNHKCEEPGKSFIHSWAYLHFRVLARLRSLGKRGLRRSLEGVNLPHLCIRNAREEQTPPRLVGTGRGGRSCLKAAGESGNLSLLSLQGRDRFY